MSQNGALNQEVTSTSDFIFGLSGVAEQNYAKELNKATYYVNEIKETVNTDARKDLLSAYEKICDVNKAPKACQGRHFGGGKSILRGKRLVTRSQGRFRTYSGVKRQT